ncbi:MAG: phosphoribosylformylglycinamidine synthase I [Patescibacteria group bacterium]|jgi:phosphoribosylformylglycinamidine synthase
MFRVAIILFPGTNCENETRRSLVNAGLEADFVRWNEVAKLAGGYDAYVLPGGFAYEDRGRAGIIAALDPIMEHIKQAAAQGKPVIGICNGCQVLVETGLIPGLANNALAGAVAINTRVKGGQIIGTGFYHDTVNIQNVAPQGRSCVTTNLAAGAVIPATVANGEGRFLFPPALLAELEQHNQILFKYCTSAGEIINEFPTTPNGAMWGIAGFCNPAGNVVAYMPHPERLERGGESLFTNLRAWLEQTPPQEPYQLTYQPPQTEIAPYQSGNNSFQMLVDLIITDNAAKTIELALNQKGYAVSVSRKTHYEVWHDDTVTDNSSLITTLVDSGELLNTSKERYTTQAATNPHTVSFLVRYAEDFEGKTIAETLQTRFGLTSVKHIDKGIVWELTFTEPDLTKRMQLATNILNTHILFNPFSQTCHIIV